ncbi:PKD domain containing protein [Methanocaldococcus infernus ME]|uniref:PKD domain containing protein n=1 Tax=Methanocaldococcus infernus (strain DSM 11812 / JCM 15783 / ME) TaxID=573063 RepID=D5VRK5_METIM|nr:PIP-CTERM sorting domain-containing protein [Methanocaldococcus infernus]ADG13208.1 PKD domain containing protein [Methanocaldococcus infernus ME]
MKCNRILIFLLFIIFNLHLISGEIYWIHPNTMNITNSTGGTEFKVNSTINFTAKAFDSFSNSVLVNGSIKWDFGDLTETEYGKEIKITHKYSFPFIYPVAWCGYLNNSGISKAITYNWIEVGDVKNIKYIFNGSPSNQWEVIYNKSKNLTVIKYPFKDEVNYEFKGIRLGSDTVKINYSPSIIVEGDEVQFNFSINRKIIFCLWSFGDGTFSFEESPNHTYNNPGIYFPRVLVVDDEGYVYVGYCEIYVNRPIGGYFEPIRNENYVWNSSMDEESKNVEDIYAMVYKVGDTIYFKPAESRDYISYDFGDGSSVIYSTNNEFNHTYKFPFIYPICWMGANYSYYYKIIAYSATLDYLVVDDVGNTLYKIIPTNEDRESYFKSYDKRNHIVELYSKAINKPITLKLKLNTHYDVVVRANKSDVGIKYSFEYPYGTPVLVFWSFGDGSYSLNLSPVHRYADNKKYQAFVMVIDSNGIVSVGYGPIVKGNSIIDSMLYVEPTIVKPNQRIYIYYYNYPNYDYLDLYFLDYGKNTLRNFNDLNLVPTPNITENDHVTYYLYYYYIEYTNFFIYKIYVKFLNVSFKIPWEGIYYVKGHDPGGTFIPRKIIVIDNKNPVAELFIYPDPAPYTDEITFNPLNSYDPDANRILENSGGEIIPPNSPAAKIYGFNITVYDSSGNIVFSYKDNYLHTVTHRFEPGNYTAVLTVWDGMGGIGNITKRFEVIDNPPVADFYWIPNIPRVDERVYLYSTSYDPNNDIVNIVWNINNNTYENVTTLLYKFKTPGVHDVTLTVTDRYNKSSSVTKEITVVGIRANFIYRYINNNTVEFESISAVYPGNITKYIWDFGDGTSEETSNPIITHRYNRSGVYLVTLTIYSNTGLSDRVSKIVYITPSAILYPKADFNYITYNNLTVLFNASSSYSPNGNITKYIWDFGDGTSEETSNPTITHRYNRSGVYLVTLTVIDNKGLSDTCSKSIYIHSNEGLNVPIPIYIKLLSVVTTILFILRYIRWIK